MRGDEHIERPDCIAHSLERVTNFRCLLRLRVIKWQHFNDRKQFIDFRLLALRLRSALKPVIQLHRCDHRYHAIAGNKRFHSLAHACIAAHKRDAGICIQEIFHLTDPRPVASSPVEDVKMPGHR
jgi:hypothetical protein